MYYRYSPPECSDDNHLLEIPKSSVLNHKLLLLPSSPCTQFLCFCSTLILDTGAGLSSALSSRTIFSALSFGWLFEVTTIKVPERTKSSHFSATGICACWQSCSEAAFVTRARSITRRSIICPQPSNFSLLKRILL